MAFYFDCFAISHIGNRRKNNEDNFFMGKLLVADEQNSMTQTQNRVIQKEFIEDGSINRIYAVSDGMGGHKHGEVASCMVTEAIMEFVNGDQKKASYKRMDKFKYIQEFQEMVQQTNLKMLQHSESESDNMGATLSGVIVFANEIVPFNIGDSSSFLYENHMLRKLTTDDNEIVRFGKCDVSELGFNGKRLTKYFGLPKSSGVLTATISTPIPIRAGQVYLISSDGLTDCLSCNSMCEILEECEDNMEKASMELVEAALRSEKGGHDNITVVIFKVHKSKQRRYKYG